MDILFNGFFDSCSLPTVIIAITVSIAVLIFNLLTKDKAPKLVKAFTPFVLAFVSYVIYDMITIKAVLIREDALYYAFICASISTIFYAGIIKIKRGEKLPVSTSVLLIESLLTDLIEKDNLQQTASEIHEIIVNGKNQPNLTEKISAIIIKATNGLDEKQAEFASVIIIQAVESLNSQKTK